MQAYTTSGQMIDDDRGWTEFASNVGKARIMRHDAFEVRLRWAGAVLLIIAVAAAGYLTFRYYGVRAGWWSTLLPMGGIRTTVVKLLSSVHALSARVLSRFSQ